MWNKILLLIILVLIATNVLALRISKPPVLNHPLTEDQINNLNKFLEDLWYLQQGRYELDVVTTQKTNARNGEIWILQTGATSQIQWKANGGLYAIGS